MQVLLYLTKQNVKLPDFSFFLYSTFIFEPILITLSMNANIIKTQIYVKESMTSEVN